MIVGIDLRCLPADGSEGAGVAHAARFLTDALLRLDVGWDWRLYLPAKQKMETSDVVRLDDVSGSSLRAAVRPHPCDLLFVPGGAVAPGLKIRSVPWVHDLAIYSHPEWFPQSLFRRLLTTRIYRKGVTSAPLVFAVSEDTKRDIRRLFAVASERIVVTHEGGDPVLASLRDEALVDAKAVARKRLAAAGLSRPFILALGTVEPRKNFATLIAAWEAERTMFPVPTDLVIAGRDGWKSEHVQTDIERCSCLDEKFGRVRRIGHVDDATRRDLLLGASVVAVPSLSEGFGLVALEAMQAGTVVIASQAGALPEVVGEAGVLVDPHDTHAWGQALSHLMADDEGRARFASEGKRLSQAMTWERVAAKVAGGIRQVLSK
ncbi:MAG: glycosyltransferase family 1 protein [Patescibacteria group bacterium]